MLWNQAPVGTAPRARDDDNHLVPASQPQDRFGCEPVTAWSPVSPSFASCDLLSTSFTDAIEEAALLTMQRAIGNNAHHHHDSSSSDGSKSEHRADDPAMTAASPYELDRDMMGMLANNWNLNAGPPRAPTVNWGFEPTPYDSEALMASSNNQPAPLAGSMMMMPPAHADVAHVMSLASSEPSYAMANNNNAQQPVSREAATTLGPDPFSAMDNNFVMPYQDCATLPVSDFPLYDGGMYKPAFDSAGGLNQFTPAGSHVNNQLSDRAAPYFGNDGPMMTAFQQGANAGPLFNEVAQPPAAAMAAINGGFAMPDLSLQEDDDTGSDWNGSSSDFSTVSSSPIANNSSDASGVSTVPLMPAQTEVKPSAMNTDGAKKPKRIRRLCSIAGCGKRARSQDLCIAHGGGRRCIVEGCEKSSQGGNMCIKHGGGKRCKHPGCEKAAQTNSLCKAHGGGPRCQAPGCTKSSQGGGFCRAHGGGKRCAADGCNKGTQRGDYCALHGGSRFCEVPGCMRNDRGGGFCAHHGGGKRCSIANCNRSCRRNGLCSTHLRLLGQETGGKVATVASPAISTAMPSNTGVTLV